MVKTSIVPAGNLDNPPSPCRRVCQVSNDGRLCLGCGRTMQEITRWAMLSPAEQRRIAGEAAARLSRIDAS